MKSQYTHFIISDFTQAIRSADKATFAPAQWRRLLNLGLSFLIFGVIAIILPSFVTLALNILFGMIVLGVGIFSSYYAIRSRPYSDDSWPAMTAFALVICGLLLMLKPQIGAISLTLIIGLFFIFTGLGKLGLAQIIRPSTTSKWILLSGLVDLTLVFLISLNLTEISNNLLGLLLGISFIMQGWWNIRLALNLRKQNSANFY